MNLELLRSLSVNKIRAEICKRSYFEFFQEFWGEIVSDPLIYNWHIEYLCNELEALGKRVFARQPKEYDLIINIPPGTSKSTICTIMFPVWCWVNDPTLRIISGSYASELSISQSVKSRDLLRSDKFLSYYGHLFGFKSDSDNKQHYENTKGGARFTTSVGGTITGKHAHIKILDDPINPKQAASDVELKSANDWVDKTFSSRNVDKKITPLIVVMQRLHEDDPTGHMLAKKGKRIKHICLPCDTSFPIQPSELRSNYVNGLLDPQRLDRDSLAEQKLDLGSYAYAGQMGQQPAPDEGGLIKKAWFDIVDMKLEWIGKTINFTVDTAYTEKETNDETAVLGFFTDNNCMYIVSADEVWQEFPELTKYLPEFCNQNGYTAESRIYVEPKASGLSLIQQLKRSSQLNIITDDPPKDDKITRVRSISAILEAKRVKLIKGQWNQLFLTRVGQFPTAKNKGLVDCLSMAAKKIQKTKKEFWAG